jgi:hypothetical protein
LDRCSQVMIVSPIQIEVITLIRRSCHPSPYHQNPGPYSPLGHIQAGFTEVDKGFGDFASHVGRHEWFEWALEIRLIY